jgi:glutathione S-transferase
VTLADYSIAALLPLARIGGIDLGPYPHVRAWLARLEEREAWRDVTVRLDGSSDRERAEHCDRAAHCDQDPRRARVPSRS